MHFSSTCMLLLSIVFGLVSLADAQQSDLQSLLSSLPACAAACARTLLPKSTCNLEDLECICSNESLITTIASCNAANCTVVESLTATNLTQTACAYTPRDNSHPYVIVVSTFLALAVFFYIVRVNARPPFTSQFAIDDVFVLLATVTVIIFTAINLAGTHSGLGRDIWTLAPDKIDKVLQYFYIGEFLYVLVLVLTKLAVLFFYLRVFPQRDFKRLSYAVMGVCVLYLVSFSFVFAFQCTPSGYFWKQWRHPGTGKCININGVGWAAAAINIVLDITILSIPIPIILKLNISKRQKWQVLSMFGVGVFITIVSIIRLRSVITFATGPNLTWHLQSISIWSSIELDVSIVCACMPATRLFLKKFLPSMFASTKDCSPSYARQSSHIYNPSDPRLAEISSGKHIVKSIHVDISHDHRDPDDELELMRTGAWSSSPVGGHSTAGKDIV